MPAPKPAPAAASPVPPAPVGFAPALTNDGPGRAGASGTTPEDPPRSGPAGRRGPGRGWRVLIGSVAVLVLLALGGWAAAALLEERSGTPRTAPAPQPGAAQSTAGDGAGLDSRDIDGLPLTAKEVFPGPQLMIDDGAPAYQVLRTQSSGACAVAASGEIADLLDRLGCDQVVRATLRSPDGQHLLTAGLFNLTDLAGAERARDGIRQLLEERAGRFSGMAAGPDTEIMGSAAARVGWQVRGHYLAYCLVTRADGAQISADDPTARQILYDLIELYLNGTVLERRASVGVASQPAAGPADGPQLPDDTAGD